MAVHFRTLGLGLALFAVLATQTVEAASGYTKLVNAVNEANKNALVCSGKENCLGKPVTLILNEDVILEQALPVLNYSAHLILRGSCPNKNNGFRCIIDGQFKYQVFPSLEYGPSPSLLEMDSLIFQKANGGVLARTFSAVYGTNLIFRNNNGGVILAQGRGGSPTQQYAGCRWANNNGTSITFGSGKFGLSYNGTGIIVRRSTFYLNKGGEYYFQGGAISLSGFGTSIFENVQFIGNSGTQDGGAIWASQTIVKLRSCSFTNNLATSGGGGAVYAESNFYYSGAVSFCSCTFAGNTAPKNPKANTLLFLAQIPTESVNKINATFCDTPIPAGSVLPAPPNGTVTVGSGKACFQKYC